MCTKQCVNNAPTFMTMQHWHRHYETGNSIQKFNIPHSYTAIDKVSQRAGYIEVNMLKRERLSWSSLKYIVIFCNCIQIWDRPKTREQQQQKTTTTTTTMSRGKKNLDINYVTIRAKRDKTDKRTKWRAIAHTHTKTTTTNQTIYIVKSLQTLGAFGSLRKVEKNNNNNNNIHQQAPHITHYTHFNKSF